MAGRSRRMERMRRAAAFVLGLAVLAAAGAAPVPAGNKVVGNDAPSWSPDGSRIAFTSFRNGKGDIYVMNADGSRQRRVTTSPAHDDLASWSPDGTRIAFVSDREGGQADIYVMDADGSDVTRLTTDPGGDYAPTWSPDRTRIAFWSNRDGNTNIYSVNVDGSGEHALTTDRANDHSPRWGPDGRIIWVSTRNTGIKQSLYVMNGDGTDQHRLTTRASFWNESRPTWSPDGSRIAFLADRDFPLGNTEIYTIGADAAGLTRLTTYPGKDDFPVWSPDGRRIAFSRGRSTLAGEIYVMNTAEAAAGRVDVRGRDDRGRSERRRPRRACGRLQGPHRRHPLARSRHVSGRARARDVHVAGAPQRQGKGSRRLDRRPLDGEHADAHVHVPRRLSAASATVRPRSRLRRAARAGAP
jgi:Tol biopolymer transport system component